MIGPRTAAALATTLLALGVAGAQGAATRRFAGKTSQGLKIHFKIAHGKVSNFDFHIDDRCPGGTTLVVHDFGFSPAMKIKRGKFGDTFHGRHGDRATIHGKVRGNTVSGSLADHTRNDKTHKFCNGKATFTLHRR